MQTATIHLALAGNSDSIIPKYNVTPAEVAVLRFIHGDDAVTEIEVLGEVQRANREERRRLFDTYGRRIDGDRMACPAVDALFPGAAARVFETFEELDLPKQMYKATAHATSATPVVADEPAVEAPAPSTTEEKTTEEDDGIGDMPPVNASKATETKAKGDENLFA